MEQGIDKHNGTSWEAAPTLVQKLEVTELQQLKSWQVVMQTKAFSGCPWLNI